MGLLFLLDFSSVTGIVSNVTYIWDLTELFVRVAKNRLSEFVLSGVQVLPLSSNRLTNPANLDNPA